jgi:hypothetical protein
VRARKGARAFDHLPKLGFQPPQHVGSNIARSQDGGGSGLAGREWHVDERLKVRCALVNGGYKVASKLIVYSDMGWRRIDGLQLVEKRLDLPASLSPDQTLGLRVFGCRHFEVINETFGGFARKVPDEGLLWSRDQGDGITYRQIGIVADLSFDLRAVGGQPHMQSGGSLGYLAIHQPWQPLAMFQLRFRLDQHLASGDGMSQPALHRGVAGFVFGPDPGREIGQAVRYCQIGGGHSLPPCLRDFTTRAASRRIALPHDRQRHFTRSGCKLTGSAQTFFVVPHRSHGSRTRSKFLIATATAFKALCLSGFLARHLFTRR